MYYTSTLQKRWLLTMYNSSISQNETPNTYAYVYKLQKGQHLLSMGNMIIFCDL
jgi:hypothetical protein